MASNLGQKMLGMMLFGPIPIAGNSRKSSRRFSSGLERGGRRSASQGRCEYGNPNRASHSILGRRIDGRTHTLGIAGRLMVNAMTWYDHETKRIGSQPWDRSIGGTYNAVRSAKQHRYSQMVPIFRLVSNSISTIFTCLSR